MTPDPPPRSQAGTTLIELIVAVAIMGIAFVAILGGIGTAIIGADAQGRDASAGVVLISAAEHLAAEALTYAVCADAVAYQSGLPAAPSPRFTVKVDKVAFWEPISNRYVAALPSCGLTPAADHGLQLIRLSVTTTSGATAPRVEVVEIVKRQAVA